MNEADGILNGWHWVATVASYGLIGIAGWLIRSLWDAVRTIEKDLPATYVRRDDFKAHADRVEAAIQRLIDKLDGKADKRSERRPQG